MIKRGHWRGRRCIWEKLTSSYYNAGCHHSLRTHIPFIEGIRWKENKGSSHLINFVGDSSSLAGYTIISTFIVAMCTTAWLNKRYPIAFMYTVVGQIASYFIRRRQRCRYGSSNLFENTLWSNTAIWKLAYLWWCNICEYLYMHYLHACSIKKHHYPSIGCKRL